MTLKVLSLPSVGALALYQTLNIAFPDSTDSHATTTPASDVFSIHFLRHFLTPFVMLSPAAASRSTCSAPASTPLPLHYTFTGASDEEAVAS